VKERERIEEALASRLDRDDAVLREVAESFPDWHPPQSDGLGQTALGHRHIERDGAADHQGA